MLTQERYQSILSTIDERGAVTVSELAEMLGASESTIRRDLTALDEMGRLRKVFGGATSIKQVGSVFEDNFSTKEVLIREESVDIRQSGQTFSRFAGDYAQFGNYQMRKSTDGGLVFKMKEE